MTRVVERLVEGGDRMLALLGDGPARPRTEAAVRSFAHGAELARAHVDVTELAHALADAPGFAWEGAGLVTSLDGRFDSLLAAAPTRAPWLFIGLGWADALGGRGIVRPSPNSNPNAWLRIDGHGFWLGLRHGARIGEASHRPTDDEAADYFDRGVGRSLYFAHGGDAAGLERAVSARARRRAAALWIGIGLALRVTGQLIEHDALARVGGEPLLRGVALGDHLLSYSQV